MGALEKIKDEQIELLVSAILTLNDREDCYKFFEDICTIAEIKAMAQRIAVAKMLQ
ncbi:MAG: YerC/YecD family TrpR-related protein, partial [Bacillota bacterium]